MRVPGSEIPIVFACDCKRYTSSPLRPFFVEVFRHFDLVGYQFVQGKLLFGYLEIGEITLQANDTTLSSLYKLSQTKALQRP